MHKKIPSFKGLSPAQRRDFDFYLARATRDFCRANGIAFFMKQAGAHVVSDNVNAEDWPDDTMFLASDREGFASARIGLAEPKGGDLNELPDDLRIREKIGEGRGS